MTNFDNKHKENNIKMTNVCEDSEKQSQIAKTIQNTVEVMVSLSQCQETHIPVFCCEVQQI